MTGYQGRCSYCGKRGEVFRIQRYGGGNWRRAGRWYSTSIHAECAASLMGYVNPGQSQMSRYGTHSLRTIAATLAADQEGKP